MHVWESEVFERLVERGTSPPSGSVETQDEQFQPHPPLASHARMPNHSSRGQVQSCPEGSLGVGRNKAQGSHAVHVTGSTADVGIVLLRRSRGRGMTLLSVGGREE